MDDGGTAKETKLPAPVTAVTTRLRRRLSVEADEVKSPSGATTPTKKRGGRLAAKPQLDLIDENVTENPPKRITRKTAAKAVVEPREEKALTPSRRSARIKSTSSILSETTGYDSPRSIRAARRTSQAGSDNETSSTPSRQTRRTRKDSTSSIDKQDDITSAKTPKISEAIIEDIETNIDDVDEQYVITRKSPHLVDEKGKDDILDISISDSERKNNKRIIISTNNDNLITADETLQVTEPALTVTSIISTNEKNATIKNNEEQATINSPSDNLLIDSLKKKSFNTLEQSNSYTSKRHRTKSWTTISVEHSNYDTFFSDNEISKKKRKAKSLNITGSGDSVTDTDKIVNIKSVDEEKEKNTSKLKEKSCTNDSMMPYKNDDSLKNIKGINSSFGTPKKTNVSKTNDKKKVSMSKDVTDSNSVVELFKYAPGVHIQSLVFTDDDSNSSAGIVSKDKKSEGPDQCVPIVHQMHGGDHLKSNTSYEPMDIDETIPHSISMNNLHENNSTDVSDCKKPLSMRKSSMSMQENKEPNTSAKKSKRKSSETHSQFENLEKSNNENKSTLILSQIKDISINEIIVATETSNLNNQEDELLKSVNGSDTAKNRDIKKANISQNYLTSTPLQQKPKKLGIQLDTSLISPKNTSKKQIDTKISLKNKHISETAFNDLYDSDKKEQKISLNNKSKDDSADSTSEEESEAESSRKQNSMMDNEAEQASDDYESGDSQNDEDREYEGDNEIQEKGETLDSEEDFSDDTDYEKDSFVVSSADDDHELLSGSGDDLCMSDNELTMSSKSKAKYNERKVKEQKKASREMYNARHRLNESESSDDKPKIKKTKRQRLDSSALISDDEQLKSQENNTKKSQDNNETKCGLDKLSMNNKKKVQLLSESVCDEGPENEKEITIVNMSKLDKVDPLLIQIKEEIQSPQKNLNISFVIVNNEVEEVNINENMSVIKSSESSDPLQVTNAVDDEECSSSSGNEEIMENYNSVLKDLHKKTKKIKSINISLNEEKKKSKIKEPIFDQLNLTLTKTKKSKKTVLENVQVNEKLQSENNRRNNESMAQNEDDAGSDSIDMRLLFPEDSNDSEYNCDNLKENSKIISAPADYIPLKRTEAKTNIRTSMGSEQDENVFFIDTKGRSNADTSSDDISKKSKSKSSTLDLLNNVDEKDETPLEITYTSEKIKKNNLCLQTSTGVSGDVTDGILTMNTSNSGNKKKKSKHKYDSSENNVDTKEADTENIVQEAAMNINYNEKRKSKLSLSTSMDKSSTQIDLKDIDDAPDHTTKETHSNKKKKKHLKKSIENTDSTITDIHETELTMAADAVLEPKLSAKKKKKAKNSLSSTDNISSIEFLGTELLESGEAPLEVLYQSKKKKKHSADNSQTIAEVETTQSVNTVSEEVPANILSGKKKKMTKKNDNSFSKSLPGVGENDGPETEEAPAETSYQSLKRKKHVKQSIGVVQDNVKTDLNHIEDVPDKDVIKESVTSKKRKRELLESVPVKNTPASINTSVSLQGNETKKIKISLNNEDIDNDNEASQQLPTTIKQKKVKKSNNKDSSIDQENDNEASQQLPATVKQMEVKKSRNKNSSIDQENDNEASQQLPTTIKQKKVKKSNNKDSSIDQENDNEASQQLPTAVKQKEVKKSKNKNSSIDQENEIIQGTTKQKDKKRKERDDDVPTKVSKVFKQSSCDKVYVERLPSHILSQLEDKPRKNTAEKKKTKVISTTEFTVEANKVTRNKPSHYLEESVYLNDTTTVKKEKKTLKKLKVLPFTPTASTSDKGFTTNFRINVLPRDNQFVAQSTDVTNFKNDCLQKNKLNKFHTFEKYKNLRKYKVSKF